MITHLVTSGCSFTDDSLYKNFNTWATYLNEELNTEKHNYGLSSSGNGMISKQALYGVNKLLTENVPANKILVGVMWSGPDRHETFIENTPVVVKDWKARKIPEYRIGIRNPYKFVEDDSAMNSWILQSAGWPDYHSQLYYTHFWSKIGAQIRTHENILRLQHYFDTVGVKYFFSSWCHSTVDQDLIKNPNVSYLHNMINWNNWLPVVGEYEWCRDNTDLKFRENERGHSPKHPTPAMHEAFTHQVIIPFLNERNIIA
jgi:hypothetical protein